ncbi:MAG: hypothetical protein LBV33_02620, partial [Lachnospiraceae bacterium]|nr:hypothetical protein [Lachnospiraceae bacterium]
MILYLTSKEHMNLLDFLMEKEEIVLPVKKMTGNFYFKKFVLYDMRNFSHCTELILDRIAFGDSDEEFIETITEFLAMYCARITVIWERLDEQKTFFDRLLVAGVTNIVAGSSANEVQSEIVQSLSREGMVKYHSRELKVATPATHYEFTAKGIRIALVGSQGRIGTTTVALGLSSWLGSVGAKICYVEKSDA